MADTKPQLIILDRDGVINHDSPDYIRSPEEWQPIEGSIEAIARLCRSGYRVYVATNQAGIARGLLSETTLQEIHRRMESEVQAFGGRIGAIFYCPHHPDDHCHCRKPEPGMLLQAAEHAGVDISQQIFIGDSMKDIQAAKAVGCKPVLVLTGNGRRTLADLKKPVESYEDLEAFAEIVARR